MKRREFIAGLGTLFVGAPFVPLTANATPERAADKFVPVRGEVLDDEGVVLARPTLKALGRDEYEFTDLACDTTGKFQKFVLYDERGDSHVVEGMRLNTEYFSAGSRFDGRISLKAMR